MASPVRWPLRSFDMRTSRTLGLIVGGLTGVSLVGASPGSVATDAQASSWRPPSPTNAGKIYRWGHASEHDEFHGARSGRWQVNKPALIRNQHGMLTLNGAERSGTLSARLSAAGHRYGRWEARVRARQYSTRHTPYRVVWELAPRNGEHCGARGIVLSQYTLGHDTARMHLRNLPRTEFTAARQTPLSDQEFHTYAVEVTKHHISWFVDTKVVMTERRRAARTGALYDVRFRLVAPQGARMNPGRMQMDWVRYYTLDRENARSIKAPPASRRVYRDAC